MNLLTPFLQNHADVIGCMLPAYRPVHAPNIGANR